jgi:hypothetical protein
MTKLGIELLETSDPKKRNYVILLTFSMHLKSEVAAIYFLTAVIFPHLITDDATLSKYQTQKKP